jgi:hypothetical protein
LPPAGDAAAAADTLFFIAYRNWAELLKKTTGFLPMASFSQKR